MMQQGASVRFTPGSFRYNGRVALALLPAMLVAAVLGGRPVLATLTMGALMWYIMDAMQYREGAFTVGWGTLLLAQAGISLNLLLSAGGRPPPVTLLLLLGSGATLALAGAWLTVNFRFVQMQHPAVVLAFERLLLTGLLPVAAGMQTLGLSAMAQPSELPYYLAALLCGLYQLFGRPLSSSFHATKSGRAIGGGGGGGSSIAAEAVVQSNLDGLCLALAVATLPAACYMAVHVSVIGHAPALHGWSLLILGSGPLVYLAAVPDGLWWLPLPRRFAIGVSRLLLVLASAGLLAGLEGRVIFHAFLPYIRLPTPWNYVAVTACLAGLAALLVAHAAGALSGGAIDPTLAGACLLCCAGAGGIALGVPLHWMPAPLVAAAGLGMFYSTRRAADYLLFAGGVMLSATWLIAQHFWFLDIRVGFLHLRSLCALALCCLAATLAMPGLLLTGGSHQALGVAALAQAELLALLEEQLHGAHHHEPPGAEQMYPPWLVIATSAAGLGALFALRGVGALPRWSHWACSCLYGAKLAVLILPEAYLLLPTAAMVLAAAAPAFAHEPQHGRRRVRLPPWQGLCHAVATLTAVALARFAVFDVVQWAVGGRPHEGLLLGALLLTAAAALAPLVYIAYAHNQAASRLTLLLAVVGLLLASLQPPLPRVGGAACPQLPLALCPRLWDERHVPMHGADDVAVWGTGLGRREHWPRWLLVAAGAFGMAGLSGALPGSRGPLVRLCIAAGVGWLVGEYLALELVPGQALLQGLVIVTSIIVVAFVTLLQNPVLGSPAWLPLLGVIWLGGAASAVLLQTTLPLPDIARFRRLYPDSALHVEAERRTAAFASLLAVFASHATLAAFALKLRGGAALAGGGERGAAAGRATTDAYGVFGGSAASRGPGKGGFGGGGAPAVDYFCGIVPAPVLAGLGRAMALEGAASLGLRRLARAGLGWVPVAGNVCTLLAFAACLWLNQYLTGGAPEALLLLSPLLLLLSQDQLLLRGLGERQRYAPPVAAFSGYLALTAAAQVLAYVVEYGDIGVLLLHGGVVALALPQHAVFLQHVWDGSTVSGRTLIALAVLSLLALFGSQSDASRYLAGSGLVMGALQHFASAHSSRAGLKAV